MSNSPSKPIPADQPNRLRALDPARSLLVQAPAGSGKTTLLTKRFLVLLGEVEDPGQIVAITFTKAAAAEMRNRVLDELRMPEPSAQARRVLVRSETLGWRLLDSPAQLRISTIDSFCRELALQQPLLSRFGGGLEVAEQPEDLYRRAARRMLDRLGESGDAALDAALDALLEWRDNNWQDVEGLIVDMLSQRDRWMQDFLLSRDPDWDALREQLEQPFRRAIGEGLTELSQQLDRVPGVREEALLLARFACGQPNGEIHRALAELAEFPAEPSDADEDLEDARQAFVCLGNLLLTKEGTFRKTVDKKHGFPPHCKSEKQRFLALNGSLNAIAGFEKLLAGARELPPAQYPEAEWVIVRACFTLLRHAAGQLQVVFAESATVDFVEVAQIAQSILKPEDGLTSEAALAVADGIRHLLVDEFQDTSRRQHRLLGRLIGAWPEPIHRTCFAVGDPMQSIYSFRDAEAELFSRVREIGLELPDGSRFEMQPIQLSANFRTRPELVGRLNDAFQSIFLEDDGSGIAFVPSEPARTAVAELAEKLMIHVNFWPQNFAKDGTNPKDAAILEAPVKTATRSIVELIRTHLQAMEAARSRGEKYRIAVLARKRSSLTPVAQALREAAIPFRAIDLEQLAARPEILDALALGRALLNPQDRVAWLGVLRAPWCGLTLKDLHVLTADDRQEVLLRPVPDLIRERYSLLSPDGQALIARLRSALIFASRPGIGDLSVSTGTWLQQIWLRLGGADCYDSTALANLNLLWTRLDWLPAGKEDLLGPGLDAALKKLAALPDPQVSSECGVQLMTIHKAKGLEFEVVIIPELEAKVRPHSQKMLSWLERGLKPESSRVFAAGETDEVTEFLVAPLPSKGDSSGLCKRWVDCAIAELESQEKRRLLYVAATRAREELHLFASIDCKLDAAGELILAPPQGLLATAWPAFEMEIRARFEDWKATLRNAADSSQAASESGEIEQIAAAAQSDLFVLPSAALPVVKPTLLRRLPAQDPQVSLHGLRSPQSSASTTEAGVAGANAQRLYARHEGGLVSRTLGTAVHTLLEELARLRADVDMPAARGLLRQMEPRVAAHVRGAGIGPSEAARMASEASQLALNASEDPVAQWILSPHQDAQIEACWTGVIAGASATVRVDRVFRAGLTPHSEGDEAWWIVDYKSSGSGKADSAALIELRSLFAPQLATYAQVLRNLHGANAVIRAGLYYPRMLQFDWWEI